MFLVRNRIINILGGQTDKIARGRIKEQKEFRFVYKTFVHWEGADSKFVGMQFMTVFVMRRDPACS